MLKKLTHPEFDLRRSYVICWLQIHSSPHHLLLLCISAPSCAFYPAPIPTTQITPVYLYICSSLTSLPHLNLLFTALPYASIWFNGKWSISSLLAPMPNCKGIAPETMLGWSLGLGGEIIPELTCTTIYLKCTWHSDFFFPPLWFISWSDLRERENWKLIQ